MKDKLGSCLSFINVLLFTVSDLPPHQEIGMPSLSPTMTEVPYSRVVTIQKIKNNVTNKKTSDGPSFFLVVHMLCGVKIRV